MYNIKIDYMRNYFSFLVKFFTYLPAGHLCAS